MGMKNLMVLLEVSVTNIKSLHRSSVTLLLKGTDCYPKVGPALELSRTGNLIEGSIDIQKFKKASQAAILSAS